VLKTLSVAEIRQELEALDIQADDSLRKPELGQLLTDALNAILTSQDQPSTLSREESVTTAEEEEEEEKEDPEDPEDPEEEGGAQKSGFRRRPNPTGIDLTWLGTSSGSPTLTRNVSGCLVRTPGGAGFLIDCGEGSVRQLSRRPEDIDVSMVTRIFITHLHGDHVFGLPSVVESIAEARYRRHTRVTDVSRTRQEAPDGRGQEREDEGGLTTRASVAGAPIHIYGPKGVHDVLIASLETTSTRLRWPVRVSELVTDPTDAMTPRPTGCRGMLTLARIPPSTSSSSSSPSSSPLASTSSASNLFAGTKGGGGGTYRSRSGLMGRERTGGTGVGGGSPRGRSTSGSFGNQRMGGGDEQRAPFLRSRRLETGQGGQGGQGEGDDVGTSHHPPRDTSVGVTGWKGRRDGHRRHLENVAVGLQQWVDGYAIAKPLSWVINCEDGFKVVASQLLHRAPCWGYVIQEPDSCGFDETEQQPQPVPGRKIVVLGDTHNSSHIEPVAVGADVVVHEATYQSGLEFKSAIAGHSTAAMAGDFARRVGAKTLVLTHFSPRYSAAMVGGGAGYGPTISKGGGGGGGGGGAKAGAPHRKTDRGGRHGDSSEEEEEENDDDDEHSGMTNSSGPTSSPTTLDDLAKEEKEQVRDIANLVKGAQVVFPGQVLAAADLFTLSVPRRQVGDVSPPATVRIGSLEKAPTMDYLALASHQPSNDRTGAGHPGRGTQYRGARGDRRQDRGRGGGRRSGRGGGGRYSHNNQQQQHY